MNKSTAKGSIFMILLFILLTLTLYTLLMQQTIINMSKMSRYVELKQQSEAEAWLQLRQAEKTLLLTRQPLPTEHLQITFWFHDACGQIPGNPMGVDYYQVMVRAESSYPTIFTQWQMIYALPALKKSICQAVSYPVMSGRQSWREIT